MQYWAENDTKWLKISQKRLLLADLDRKISLKVLKVDIYHSGQVFQVILRKNEQKGLQISLFKYDISIFELKMTQNCSKSLKRIRACGLRNFGLGTKNLGLCTVY